MKIKSRRIMALSTIFVVASLVTSPAYAEDPVATVLTAGDTATAVVTAAVITTGTIHVENIVVNDNLGTKTAADFELTIKHFGTNIAGSPFSITETSGTHFVLEAGTYVVGITAVDGYLGTWSGEGIENGFIDLKAGQDITITRNTYDVGVAKPVYPTVEPTVDPMTEDGGTLPVTGTNWFNALALGLLLSAAGALAIRKTSLGR